MRLNYFVVLKNTVFFIALILFVLKGKSQHKVNELINNSKKAFNTANYQEGLKLALKALKEAEKTNDPINLANANLQVGVAYYYNNQDRKEDLVFFYAAKKYIYQANIDSLKPRINHNIGAVYTEIGEIDSAEFYFKEVFSLLANTNKYVELSKSCAVLAELNFHKENLPMALKYIEKAEKYAQLSKSDADYAFARIKRALYHVEQKQYKEAIPYYEEVKAIYEKEHNEQGMQYVYRLLADATANAHNPKIAELYEDYYLLKDSLFKKESAEKLALYKTTFETEKKEQENKLLQQENELIESEVKKRNRTIVILIITLLLIIIIVGWRLNVIKLKRKEQLLLSKQAELEAKEKERNRLAAELHDNVGSSVSYMSLKLDKLMEQDGDNQEIAQLKQTTQEILSGLRETLWTLNAKNISNIDLCDKLKVYIKTHLFCSVKIEDMLNNEFQIPNEDVLTLYRCSQEIINNINKHSKATMVLVKFISTNENQLTMIFSDNGIGFKHKEKSESYGLRNIKARMDKINGKIEVNSVLRKGTEITLEYKKFSA